MMAALVARRHTGAILAAQSPFTIVNTSDENQGPPGVQTNQMADKDTITKNFLIMNASIRRITSQTGVRVGSKTSPREIDQTK